MQSELPNPQDDVPKEFDFDVFLEENWMYLVIVFVIVYIVVMYSKILRERRKNKNSESE
ncbi:hypothetical protein [Psychroflexus aestuariivivens]|uniref:hypothetical protein n=1 Tax=Psychroflexus aestuariivivens TaxID=1795040 RepID=UPI001864AB5B|nr:hypothetical protein [Psychroflexus aestuariivivens]